MTNAAKGGPGSGNWGHAGRPGLVGGSASGNGNPSPASVRRLKDGPPPLPPINAARIAEMHPKWTLEQATAFAQRADAERARADVNKVTIDSGSAHYLDIVRSGRVLIRKVHAEVGGFTAKYATLEFLTAMWKDAPEATRGCYASRTIWISARARVNDYVHEYGHYIDNLLGNQSGKAWFSDGLTTIHESLRREFFAETYAAWIQSRADPRKTYALLGRTGWQMDRPKFTGLVAELDRVLRAELGMVP